MQGLELLESKNPQRSLAIIADNVPAPNGVRSEWPLWSFLKVLISVVAGDLIKMSSK